MSQLYLMYTLVRDKLSFHFMSCSYFCLPVFILDIDFRGKVNGLVKLARKELAKNNLVHKLPEMYPKVT